MMLRARSSVTWVTSDGGRSVSSCAYSEPQPSSSPRLTVFSKRPPTWDAAPRPLIADAPGIRTRRAPNLLSPAIGLAYAGRVANSATTTGPDAHAGNDPGAVGCVLDDSPHPPVPHRRVAQLPDRAGILDRAAEARTGRDPELAHQPGGPARPGLPDLLRVRPAEDHPASRPAPPAPCRTAALCRCGGK